ncbi:MAG: A/G-specific adenine glycosylase [Pedosphaera sp.]|nr:A/G-specific adenine glycosylase [Pedosphaera sp.]
MLQQTQVKTVIPYWERWMRSLPTLEALAQAKPEEIHKLWEGLGYYARVRNMQKAAQQILAEHGGKFPQDYGLILALPGIGRYTAGAIASIAFNEPKPILDGNVIRVLTRLFDIAENPREKATNGRLWRLSEELVTSAFGLATPARTHCCSHLNQALMELGALICTPKQPKCLLCPVRTNCVAYRTGKVEQLPNLGPRTAATSRNFIAFVVERNGRFLVRQRPVGVVNAHLWEFPNLEITTNGSDLDLQAVAQTALGTAPGTLEKLCTVKHTITRYRITLKAFRGVLPKPAKHSNAEERWFTLLELKKHDIPSAHRRIFEHL